MVVADPETTAMDVYHYGQPVLGPCTLRPCHVQVQAVLRYFGDVTQSDGWKPLPELLRARGSVGCGVDGAPTIRDVSLWRLKSVLVSSVLAVWDAKKHLNTIALEAVVRHAMFSVNNTRACACGADAE